MIFGTAMTSNLRIILLGVLLVNIVFTAGAGAALKTTGRDENLNIDQAMIPASSRQAYDTMRVRCIKCHTRERVVVAIKTGIAPISSGVFNKTATKAYGIKMLRKKDSNMSKQEVSIVIELLNFLLDEAER